MEKPNRVGQFDINFNRHIVLPDDIGSWTSENEGAQRLAIKLVLSEETEELLQDLELSIDLSWYVIDKSFRQVKFNGGRRRELGVVDQLAPEEDEQAENSMIEVDRIRVQMNFTLPELVSQGLKDKDKIVVEMLPEIFTEEIEFRPGSIIKTESEDYSFSVDLEKQTSKDLDEVISMLLSAIRAVMFGFATSNVILSFFFSQVIQLLWGAINTLQMIVLTVLFNVSMPVNAYAILIEIMKITNLDVIDTSWLLDKLIELTETPSFNYKFLDAGYEMTTFFIELGPLLFLVLASAAYFAIRAPLSRLYRKSQSKNCCVQRMQKRVNYRGAIIRFLLEGCIELGLIAMICIICLGERNWSSW